jgi:hypothetical protein
MSLRFLQSAGELYYTSNNPTNFSIVPEHLIIAAKEGKRILQNQTLSVYEIEYLQFYGYVVVSNGSMFDILITNSSPDTTYEKYTEKFGKDKNIDIVCGAYRYLVKSKELYDLSFDAQNHSIIPELLQINAKNGVPNLQYSDLTNEQISILIKNSYIVKGPDEFSLWNISVEKN